MTAGRPACLGPPVLASPARAAEYTKSGLWGQMSLPTLFFRHADTDVDALALADGSPISGSGPRRHRQLTYGEAEHAVRRIAARFSDCGLTPGDVVALQLPPQIEEPVTLLACLGLGFIVCPLPHAWRHHEIEMALARLGARAIVCWGDEERMDAACRAAFRVPSIRFVFAYGNRPGDGVTPLSATFDDDGAEALARSEFPLLIDPNALALVNWDLAAPGSPRAIARSHNECIAAAMPTILTAPLTPGATIHSPIGFSGLTGLSGGVVPWAMTGGLLALHHPFDPELWRQEMTVYEPDLALVPSGLAPALTPVLREADCAREPTLAALRRAGTGRPLVRPDDPEVNLIELLSLGEVAMVARPVASDAESDDIPLGAIRATPGSGPVVLETACADLPDADDGAAELIVRGAQTPSAILASGSDGHGFRPAADRDGFVATGLHARISADGASAMLVPAPDVTGHGAAAVSLAELDALYASHDAVIDAAALATDDPVMGTRIVAAVVPGPGGAASLEALIAHLTELGVARYKLPDRIVALDAIPRDAQGTIERAAIRAAL